MTDEASSLGDGDEAFADGDARRQTHVDAAVAFLEDVLAEAEAVVAADMPDLGDPVAYAAPKAVALLRRAERLVRLANVVRVDAIATVERHRAHLPHGHTSARAMAAHLGRLHGGEAARADKIRRMVGDCDLIHDAWRGGELSVDQAAVLTRAYANPRIRDRFVQRQSWFLKIAAKPFKVFERRVGDWVRLADQDGPTPRPEPGHENRDVTFVQDHFAKQWTSRGSFGSLQGAELKRIHDAYTAAERLADWDLARKTHGDDACRENLRRTEAQRRADALAQIFADAVDNPNRAAPVETCHNIVWSQESFEHAFRRFLGDDPDPIDIDQHRCDTLDGHGLDPTAAFADALISNWRRVVVSADGISLDASAKQRFYTGLARLGAQINFDSCFWHGCHVPPSVCQIDHRKPASRGGMTTQENSEPACETHNRLKERGYIVTRLPDGTIQIRSPYGDIIPD